VPAAGWGGVSLARAAARGVVAADVERSVGEALESGLGLVDVIRDDDSERVVGNAVRALRARDRATVATHVEVGWRWQPEAFHRAIEGSLRATRLEPLPLVQIAIDHDLFAKREWAEIAETCAMRTKAGDVVRWAAVIERDPREPPLDPEATASEARRICAELASHRFVAIQLAFNLCEREGVSLLDAARGAGLGVLALRPLAGGALAGTLAPGVALPPNDDRRGWDEALLERIALGAAKLAAHTQIVPPAARATAAARAQLERNPRLPDRPCRTLAELALRFVIDRGTIAMPGLHRREWISDAIAAANAPPLPFDPTLLDI
jgi:aryl-alcohol dehydrogenase-like predicted oxidoreductase